MEALKKRKHAQRTAFTKACNAVNSLLFQEDELNEIAVAFHQRRQNERVLVYRSKTYKGIMLTRTNHRSII